MILDAELTCYLSIKKVNNLNLKVTAVQNCQIFVGNPSCFISYKKKFLKNEQLLSKWT